MKIQSLSIVVPAERCWNKCPFCVSRMHCENYGESIIAKGEQIPESYLNRMEFVRDEGCNSMIITGDTEPQQNMNFIRQVLYANKTCMKKPFYNISLQTTGSNLNETDIAGMADLGLTTISFSISSFDPDRNAEIIGMPEKAKRDLYDVHSWAKRQNLVTRASINLTDEFEKYSPADYFDWAQMNGFDQITFRKIYADGDNAQSRWIAQHAFPEGRYDAIQRYVMMNGVAILRLPFGHIKYSVHGISTVIDDNCMSKDNIDDLKYAILRPNGHLYSRWDDPGSLIF